MIDGYQAWDAPRGDRESAVSYSVKARAAVDACMAIRVYRMKPCSRAQVIE